MLVRSKIFPQFVEKIEKLKLYLSKQRNKMLKIRSEMLKTRKKGKTIKPSGKIPGNFSREFPEFRGFLGSRDFPVENLGKKGNPEAVNVNFKVISLTRLKIKPKFTALKVVRSIEFVI